MKRKLRKGLNKEILRKDFRVAMFGSARLKRGSQGYKMVYALAKQIAEENIDIVTGGGPGAMEAANKGHKAGSKGKTSHSLGLTITLPHEQETNQSLDIKENFLRFSERLDNFVLLANVVVVTPGGIGTVLELIYTWQLLQVGHICNMPIILLGEMWTELIGWMKKWQLKNQFVKKEDFKYVFIAKNPQEAMQIIREANTLFKAGKDTCVNFDRYRIKIPLKVRVL